MVIGIVATSLAGMFLGITLSFAIHKIAEIRTRVHHARRFFAALEYLMTKDRVPEAVIDELMEVAELINSREFAVILAATPFDSFDDEESGFDLSGLSEKQLAIFGQAMIAFGMAMSYLAGKKGRKFRTKLIDRFSDQRTVVSEARQIKRLMSLNSEPELCAA
jgi:hypothetical protein